MTKRPLIVSWLSACSAGGLQASQEAYPAKEMKNIKFLFILSHFLFIGFLACSCTGISATSRHPTYTEPPETGDGWHTGSILEVGLDHSQIDRLLTDIHRGALKNIYAVMIVKDRQLVVDEYFNGADRSNIGLVASTTKSLTSLLVGIALEESGGNKSVDTPLRDFFPAYSDLFLSQKKNAITLYDVLTMTAGLDWDERTFQHPHRLNANTQMYAAEDPVRFILDRKTYGTPGQQWNYNSGLSVLLGEVIRNLSGEDVDAFAEKRLFGPLEFTRFQWNKHENGTVWSNGDLYIRPRDLAKVGQLVLDEGKWDGHQIVPEMWVNASTQSKTKAQHGYRYGYQWWLGTARCAERRLEVIFASGTGGQKLFIIPEVDMVVVVMSKVFGNKGGQERATRILTEYVLPAAMPKIEPTFAMLDATCAKKFVGEYYNADDEHTFRIEKYGNTLFARPTLFSQFEIKRMPHGTFYGRWGSIGDIYIDFMENKKGDVISANVDYLLGRMIYRKMN